MSLYFRVNYRNIFWFQDPHRSFTTNGITRFARCGFVNPRAGLIGHKIFNHALAIPVRVRWVGIKWIRLGLGDLTQITTF